MIESIFCSLILTVANTHGHAPVKSPTEAAITANYAVLAKGLKTKDIVKVMSVCSPNFTFQTKGSRGNVGDYRLQIASSFKQNYSLESYIPKINKLTLQGKTKAVADVSIDSKYKEADKNGKIHITTRQSKWTDTWVAAGKNWRLAHRVLISQETKVDGKAFHTLQSGLVRAR